MCCLSYECNLLLIYTPRHHSLDLLLKSICVDYNSAKSWWISVRTIGFPIQHRFCFYSFDQKNTDNLTMHKNTAIPANSNDGLPCIKLANIAEIEYPKYMSVWQMQCNQDWIFTEFPRLKWAWIDFRLLSSGLQFSQIIGSYTTQHVRIIFQFQKRRD